MRRTQRLLLFRTGTTALVLCGLLSVGHSLPVRADTANVPSLVISQLKITSSSGQFITLYNAGSSALDMSKYQLQYFNNYDLSKATSSKLIALSGIVPPHSYFMVNDGDLLLCYRLTIDSVTLGLSSTAGLVEVLAFNQSAAGGSITPVLQDYVGWSKTTAVGPQTLPSSSNGFLQRQPVDAANNPTITTPGSGAWQSVQPDTSNACNLVNGTGGSGGSSGAPVLSGLNQLLPATEPPATIVALGDNDTPGVPTPILPTVDIGLMSPVITELLPNPNGTGNDATDEFIELYNPNSVNFDLSGFSLQAGTTTLHTFTIPSGTTLPAQSFKVFYAADTGLSMSNSGGQVKLFDPFGSSIAASGVYGTAADGQSWALANGQWYWTTSPTPGAANVIKQPVSARKTSATKSASSKSASSLAAGKVKAAKTAKTKLATTGSSSKDAPVSTPIHLWTFALVAGLALLYGVYEYRGDLANRIYQLRRHFSDRRADRN